MKIRKFKEEDRKEVIQLWENCGLTRKWNDPNKDIDRKISFQSELFFVGEINNKIISSAMAGYDGHRGSVYYLAVNPSHHGQGYGKQMMEKIETTLKVIGCPKINIVIRTSNKSVQEFYSTLGYVTEEVVSIGKRLIPDA